MLPDEIHSYLPDGYFLVDYPKGVSITKATVLHLKCPKGGT